jgi:chromosome segregation ATPase
MAETDENLAALDQKIVELRAELDRLVTIETQAKEPDQNHEETISDVEVQLQSLIRQRKELGEAA